MLSKSLSFRMTMLALLAGSVAVVGGALVFQYVGGLAPCELCLYERWPYYAAIVVAAATWFAAGNRPGALGGSAVLLLLLFIASAVLGFYHFGVEQHWFAGPTACTGTGKVATTLDELRAQLTNQQPVRCDQPQFVLFGISLAGFNFLASIVLADFALSAVLGTRRKGQA